MYRSALVTLALVAGLQVTLPDPVSPDPKGARPIEAIDSVFIEDMTWMEVRDAMKSGKDTVIIATGGIEQNGPHLAANKHNIVLRATTNAIARKLGNALVAPIVGFVPEGADAYLLRHLLHDYDDRLPLFGDNSADYTKPFWHAKLAIYVAKQEQPGKLFGQTEAYTNELRKCPGGRLGNPPFYKEKTKWPEWNCWIGAHFGAFGKPLSGPFYYGDSTPPLNISRIGRPSAGEVPGGVDEPNVREGLWEVAEHPLAVVVPLLRQQAHVVADGEQSLEDLEGLVVAPGHRQVVDEPERAQEERALTGRQAIHVGGLQGLVAQHQTLVGEVAQVLLLGGALGHREARQDRLTEVDLDVGPLGDPDPLRGVPWDAGQDDEGADHAAGDRR